MIVKLAMHVYFPIWRHCVMYTIDFQIVEYRGWDGERRGDETNVVCWLFYWLGSMAIYRWQLRLAWVLRYKRESISTGILHKCIGVVNSDWHLCSKQMFKFWVFFFQSGMTSFWKKSSNLGLGSFLHECSYYLVRTGYPGLDQTPL